MKIARLTGMLALAALSPLASAGEIYKCVGNASTIYSDSPCPGGTSPAIEAHARSVGTAGKPDSLASDFERVGVAAAMIEKCPLDRARTQGLHQVVDSVSSQVRDRYRGRTEVLKAIEGRVAELLASPKRQSACEGLQAAIDDDFHRVALALAAIPGEDGQPGEASDVSNPGLLARIAFAEEASARCADVEWRQVHAVRDIELAARPLLAQGLRLPKLDAIKSGARSRALALLGSSQHASTCHATLLGIDEAFRLLSTTVPPLPTGLSPAH